MKSIKNPLMQIFLVYLALGVLGCAGNPSEETQAPEPQVERSVEGGTAESQVRANKSRNVNSTEAARLSEQSFVNDEDENDDRELASIEVSDTAGTLGNTDYAVEDQASRGGGFSWFLTIALAALIVYLGTKVVRSRRKPIN